MTRKEEIQMQAEKKALEPSRLMHPYAKQHKVMSAYEIGFIEGAVWADQHPHWISVEDEMPLTRKDVLVFTSQESVQIAQLRYPAPLNDWWDSDGRYMQNNKPTHWMPLPQAPTCSEFPNNSKKGGEQ